MWWPWARTDLDAVIATIDPRLCVACKGARALCGYDPCPLLQKIRHQMPRVVREDGRLGRDLFGSSPPSLFVGRHGYPNVTIGPMLPPEHRPEEEARRLDSPADWLSMSIPDVVALRSSLVRTTHAVSVASAARFPDRITRLSQELAVAARPVDTEVHLARPPRFGQPTVGEFTAPHGPTVEVERAQLAENVRVERRMEAVTSDTDLRAAPAVVDLYRSGTSLYQLERVLSAGMLGLGHKRRLVPTRWAITATDDQVGKDLIRQVQALPTLDKPRIHAGALFGNRFLVLLLPRVWSYGLVEAWMQGSFWTWAGGAPAEEQARPIVESDWEGPEGRKDYAKTAGGYYAARIPVLEHLVGLRRQATAIVLREVTDEYTTPLGVWVVREACRKAMATRPFEFEDVAAALAHMDRHALLPAWRAHAPFVAQLLAQRTLDAY